MGSPHRVGIIGVGVISRAYLKTFAEAESVQVTALADIDLARAEAAAAEIPGAQAMTVEALLASDQVDTVLNLTIPAAHAEIALKAIAAGKHVFGEKPLAATYADAVKVIAAGAAAGVWVGCAPDTVLGTGIQTARAVIEAGSIGRPVGASATMVTPGHEAWHPAPDFYYQAGGGPVYDMGPYYVTALIHLLGPVRSVVGMASRTRAERTITSQPRSGEVIRVDVPTHVTGVLEHEGGALSTLIMTFDGAGTKSPNIEVQGELGSLTVPDPNQFSGEVTLKPNGGEWAVVPTSAGYEDSGRGVGIVDFAASTSERPARANGDVALHALEVMTALHEAAASGTRAELTTTCVVPPAVPFTAAEEWRA
ncbi:MAG TPA: Gfo/Idh/MocA family oxidoreductase [Candidatus Lumbricidophila sp.]|nr:Gfo/Idh/MocA family oxidoreductase [Candidatus Lumbricidophila sp.]